MALDPEYFTAGKMYNVFSRTMDNGQNSIQFSNKKTKKTAITYQNKQKLCFYGFINLIH